MGEYTQATGDTLDFNLAGIDQYTQPSGSTLDFELIEATTLQVAETLGVKDNYNRSIDYFRQNTETVIINDADIRQLERTLQETAFLNDAISKTTKKPVSETVTLDDVYSQAIVILRTFSEDLTVDAFTQVFAVVRLDETLALNDSDIRQVEKLLLETLGLNDNYSRTGTFFRHYQDVFTLNEAFNGIRARFLDLTEAFTLNDTSELLTVLRLDEQVTVDETYSRVGDFFRNYIDTLGLNEQSAFFMQKQLTEGFSLATFAPISTVVRLDEQLTLDEQLVKKPVKSFDETISLNDVIRERNVFAVKSEGIGINDADIRELQRTLEESIGGNDVYSRTGTFFRDYSEEFVLDDADTKLFMKKLETETLGFDDERTSTVGKVLQESFSLAEVFITDADYFRNFTENIEVAEIKEFTQVIFRNYDASISTDDSLTKAVTKALDESLTLDDVFNQFFSEGPGTPPYYVRNSFVQANSIQNAFEQMNSIQNLFESVQINNSFGNQEQT